MSQYFESHTNQFCPLQRHFDDSLRLLISARLLSIKVIQILYCRAELNCVWLKLVDQDEFNRK